MIRLPAYIYREIVKFLLLFPDSSQKEISKYLKKHRTTISFHMKKLIKADIVESFSKNNRIRYNLKDPDYLFMTYLWSYGYKPKIGDNSNGTFEYVIVDSVIKRIYEVFPHPYHV